MPRYFNIAYTGKEATTITKYIASSESKVWNMTESEFLNFSDDDGVSNLEKIYSAYDELQKAEWKNDYMLGRLQVIVPNTNMSLPQGNTDPSVLTLYGDNQFKDKKTYNAYWSDNYNTLINSDGYVKVDQITEKGQGIDTQIINVNCRVWIWIRSIDKIINISPFISNLNTSKGEGAGSFNIIVDPVVDLSSVFFSGSNVINYFNVEQPSKEHVKDFFTKKLQNNDVVFIRYEKLGLEEESSLLSGVDDAFEINKSSLCGNTEDPFSRNWDMIGLIDGVRSSYSSGSTDRFVNVSGRDLTKLLIEDASYFIPVKFIEGSDKRFIWGGNEEDSWYKRNMVSGSYDYYFAYTMKEFKTAIGFIVNHLSNLGVTSDELFSSYGDKISKVKDIPTQDVNYIVDKKVKGIWQIIKFFVDPAIEFRRIADDSLANPDGTLFEYIKKLCQEPFVEFWGDTNGDTYDFVLRQPPFTKEAIQGVAKEGKYITVENKDLYNYDFDFDDRFYSFYQIEPENTFLGEDKNSMLAYIPIIYFNQIAETFGNKRLIVKDNYISMRALTGGDVNLNFDIFISTLLPDYKFIIDTNHYLPFTRKGNITINGDRRIKRGTFIRLEATDELFYVTDVSHSLSIGKGKIDRTTTLQVERGMVFDYILGKSLSSEAINKQARFNKSTGKVETTQKYFNYFDIVDTQLIYDTIVQNVNQNKLVTGGTATNSTIQSINSTPQVYTSAKRIKETVKTKFGINEEIFNFFLTRKQFD